MLPIQTQSLACPDNLILSDSHTTVHLLLTKPYRIGTIIQMKELFFFFLTNEGNEALKSYLTKITQLVNA